MTPDTRLNLPLTWAQLVDVWCYLLELRAHNGLPDELQCLCKAVDAKIKAVVRRELYTAYKTAKTPEERERARQQYMDEVGIPDAYRWPEGYDPYDHTT